MGTLANSAKPDQTRQDVASDQVLHYLLTEVNKSERNTMLHPLKQKLTVPIDNGGKFPRFKWVEQTTALET